MEHTACRKALIELLPPLGTSLDNPGLAIARYLPKHATRREKREGRRPEAQLIRVVAQSGVGEAYKTAFDRWKRLVLNRGFYAFTGTTASPLALGLANESPLEVGIRLNFTYGVPEIPGSALKGLSRRVALLLIESGGLSWDQFEVVFGKAESDTSGAAASCMVFWDAWFDPSGKGPFKQDVITVHHPDYYARKGEVWPTDFDDPNPVPFMVVPAGARFLFSVSAPDSAWAEYVANLMRWGLVNLGIGGKTNSGYGRFSDAWERLTPPKPSEQSFAGCNIIRKVVKGAVIVTIHAGDEQIRPEQRDWQPLEESLPPDKREQLRKKGTLRADIVVRHDKSGVKVLSVTPL